MRAQHLLLLLQELYLLLQLLLLCHVLPLQFLQHKPWQYSAPRLQPRWGIGCPSPCATSTTHCEQQDQDSPAQQSRAHASHHQVPGGRLGIHLQLLPRRGLWLELPLAADSWLLRAARGQELQHTPRAG